MKYRVPLIFKAIPKGYSHGLVILNDQHSSHESHNFPMVRTDLSEPSQLIHAALSQRASRTYMFDQLYHPSQWAESAQRAGESFEFCPSAFRPGMREQIFPASRRLR